MPHSKSFSDIASVARISEELASELGLEFQDYDRNYVISLQLAQFLKPIEFEVIPQNCDVALMPVIPTKPIIKR